MQEFKLKAVNKSYKNKTSNNNGKMVEAFVTEKPAKKLRIKFPLTEIKYIKEVNDNESEIHLRDNNIIPVNLSYDKLDNLLYNSNDNLIMLSEYTGDKLQKSISNEFSKNSNKKPLKEDEPLLVSIFACDEEQSYYKQIEFKDLDIDYYELEEGDNSRIGYLELKEASIFENYDGFYFEIPTKELFTAITEARAEGLKELNLLNETKPYNNIKISVYDYQKPQEGRNPSYRLKDIELNDIEIYQESRMLRNGTHIILKNSSELWVNMRYDQFVSKLKEAKDNNYKTLDLLEESQNPIWKQNPIYPSKKLGL